MNKKIHCTSIGGQAVIEGIMMRGPDKSALAVRNPNGEIIVDELAMGTKKKHKILRLPIIRGAVNFAESLIIGYKTLSRSAEIAGSVLDDEEPSKFEKWLSKRTGATTADIIMYTALALGIGFALLLFTVLPAFLTSGLNSIFKGALGGWKTLIEGIIRLTIFIAYLAAVSSMKDIKRIFEYHGGEHKTIHCYEAGLELNVENVRKQKRQHPRCGTSFLLIVMLVSIVIFSLPIVTWDNILLRIVTKVLLLPLVAGISYEIIKFAGRHDNFFTRIISAPGMWLQNLTTKEPDDEQIEVAIAAINVVLPQNKEDDKW